MKLIAKQSLGVFLIVVFLTITGGIIRFYDLAKNKVSLNNDEVSYGYNAYSILKTGKDEYGNFMPLTFKSVGDYKNPVLIYSLVPSIYFFGLNEFSVRFTTALAATFTIPVFFFLTFFLTKSKLTSILASTLLTFSPWHIYYSRFASDHLMGTFFLMIGMVFFQLMLKGQKISVILSAFFLVLSMYTYHPQRLFVPLFLVVLFLFNFTKTKDFKKNLLVFVILCLVLALPLIYLTFFKQAATRVGMVFLSQDIDYTRYVILDHIYKNLIFGNEYLLLFFFWIKRYLNFFQADFLFFSGLNMTTPASFGLGVLHLFELPWLILGVVQLIRKKIPSKLTLVIWILIGLIPASLTNNEQSAGRSLLILPPLLIIVSLGASYFINLLTKLSRTYLKLAFSIGYGLLILLLLLHAYLVFAVFFPLQKGEAFMEGTKEAVLYALENKENYKEIVFDPYRGIDAGDIVNIPHMYILFYSKYDPNKYQQEVKSFTSDQAHFDKFTIRRINWRKEYDKGAKNTLFIGSPWSLPQKDLQPSQILKRIYLSNSSLALLIVRSSN